MVIDIVIKFFLFGALTAMIAGSGAIFEEQFNIPSFGGNVIMMAASLLTTLLGINGVISAMSFVARLTDPDGPRYKLYVVISSIGFTNLVRYLYSAVGYAGLLLLGGLIVGMVKSYNLR